jgi:hypothetical protein
MGQQEFFKSQPFLPGIHHGLGQQEFFKSQPYFSWNPSQVSRNSLKASLILPGIHRRSAGIL